MRRTHRDFKQIVRDFFIFVVSVCGISCLYRWILRFRGPLVRVVVFHDVPDTQWFELTLRTLTESFNIISPEEFQDRNFHPKKVNILLTFDDGYASWVEIALPLLRKYQVKGLFFVSSELLTVAHDEPASQRFMREKLLIRPRKALTWDGARTLLKEGHLIGGHGCTHADLTKLSEETLRTEVGDDKSAIEQKLGVVVTEFAYPFGTRTHVGARAADAAKTAGYLRAYTAISRFVPGAETFFIPRMCLDEGLSPQVLRWWVRGAYDLFDMLKCLCVR